MGAELREKEKDFSLIFDQQLRTSSVPKGCTERERERERRIVQDARN